MKRLFIIILMLILAVSLTTACGDDPGPSGGGTTQQPPAEAENNKVNNEEALPEEDTEEEEDGDKIDIENAVWILEATVEDSIDVGALKNLSGIYQNYIFNIELSHVGLIPSGDFYLTMDVEVTTNSDEAANNLASAMLGGDVGGALDGVFNATTTAHVEQWDDSLTVSKKAPAHMIKDKNGNQVSLEGFNYFMDETLMIPYEGVSLMGSGAGDVIIRLFVVFYWEVDLEYDNPDTKYWIPADVYITYPDFKAKQGLEIWHHGEGKLNRYPNNYKF